MGLQRLIALILFAGGLYLLGRDAATLLSHGGQAPEALDALWRRIDSSSLIGLETLIETRLPRGFWDDGMATILRLPAWTLPLAAGGLLLVLDIFAQRRGR